MKPFLIIDNYDSFTFNLQHLLATELGLMPTVCHHEEIPFAALGRGEFQAIVISPGPGRPESRADFGGCREAILGCEVPILGVCLGHQGIATAFGGAIAPAPRPVHGEATEIRHEGATVFDGVPGCFEAVRYHSWVVAEPLPDCLEVTARAADGSVMGIAHRERPIWGVQFHPESIGTPTGATILRNFVDLAGGGAGIRRRREARTTPVEDPSGWTVVVEEIDRCPDPERAFQALFGAEDHAFWLDGADGAGRTFIGRSVGPGGEVLTQEPGEHFVRVTPREGELSSRVEGTIFDLLRGRLRGRRLNRDLPLDLPGGYVGYFGYGLKSSLDSPNRKEASTPDACFMAATEIVVIDHEAAKASAIVLVPPGGLRAAARSRAAALRRALEELPPAGDPATRQELEPFDLDLFDLALDRSAYLEAVVEAQRELVAGESYELCLTNQISVAIREVDPLRLFIRQRRLNPAPHGAFLRLGRLAIMSSSPERFLRISAEREVEARPIKGTRPRGTDPREDERLREELRTSVKDRAENLMIVDLLRNDLSRACEPGSVVVEELFGLETHPHVHQLVSTIQGRLRTGGDPVGCIEACFPGGSMTGAPKLRSMEILERLEPAARGVYSGALGYLGLGGVVDLSIVIRTAVLQDGVATVGSGGAVTVRSEPEAEWREMLVKAAPTLAVLAEFARAGRSSAIRSRTPSGPRAADCRSSAATRGF